MLDKFWESVGENLAGEWLKYIFSPSFLFWVGGVGMYVLSNGWQGIWHWLNSLQIFEQIALLLMTLLILVFSSLLMRYLRFTVLRLLEGYWPWPFGWMAIQFATLQNWLFERREKQWNNLKIREKVLTPEEARKLVELELNTHYFPSKPKDIQPTALGNILRAAETIPTYKYGLDAFTCWPRLWLLLPDAVCEDPSAARQSLMTLVEIWAWGLLFLVWAIWSLFAIPIAILWMWLAFAQILQAAMVYADLLEATFDLYRWTLYESAHWPLPETSGEAEIAAGQRLTEFLWRGELNPPVKYHSK